MRCQRISGSICFGLGTGRVTCDTCMGSLMPAVKVNEALIKANEVLINTANTAILKNRDEIEEVDAAIAEDLRKSVAAVNAALNDTDGQDMIEKAVMAALKESSGGKPVAGVIAVVLAVAMAVLA